MTTCPNCGCAITWRIDVYQKVHLMDPDTGLEHRCADRAEGQPAANERK